MAYQETKEAERRAAADFLFVRDAARPAYEQGQLSLFHDDREKHVRHEVERKLYEPTLPNGGEKERKMIERLKRLMADKNWEGRSSAAKLIPKYEAVLPLDPRNAGRYYSRRVVTAKTEKKRYEWLRGVQETARHARQWDRKWFADLCLEEGLPEPVSDFCMECLFLLRKANGSVERLVRLKNVMGEVSKGSHHKGAVILNDEAFASPEKFRRWCLSWGNFGWKGNQVDLQMLHEDVNRTSAYRVINQVDSCGWLRVDSYRLGTRVKSGIWFMDECAYAEGADRDGKPVWKLLRPDDDGIYWWLEEGYYLNRKGRESNFAQRRPKMKPEVNITSLGWKELGLEETANNRKPSAGPAEAELYREYFRRISRNLFDTLGGYEGWLAMGAIFSFGGAPELFEKHEQFPGLFIHGQMESGKTKLTSWLLHFWGFDVSAGIGLLKGSAVGLMQECENYSNLPLWVDEYRRGVVDAAKEAVLRDAFNRQPAVKWSPDGEQRVMRTSFIVSGESTSKDSAFRSRFPHIQVSAANRLANHLDWMDAQKGNFFLLGRLLLERRREFVELLQSNLNDWMRSPKTAKIPERERLVHGIDWAAYAAMTTLCGGGAVDSQEPTAKSQQPGMGEDPYGAAAGMRFMEFMIEHAVKSAADVTSETNINVFWDDLLTAFKAGEIDTSCFRILSDHVAHPPGCPNQSGGWRSYRLYFDPEAVVSELKIFLSKQRSEITLERKDLRDQLSKNDYWIKGAKGKISMRFGPKGDTTSIKCWGFDLDKHPMGYQPATDEEVDHFLRNPDEPDPRKGPLFTLVHALEQFEGATR